jgi:hypothetical protein
LLTLEQETLQNNLLFEKFIRRLDEQFEITKNVDLTAVKVGHCWPLLSFFKKYWSSHFPLPTLSLDDFSPCKFVTPPHYQNEAHFAAQSVSARLAEENAPPMPSFTDLYSDPAALNDAVDGAMAGLDDQVS